MVTALVLLAIVSVAVFAIARAAVKPMSDEDRLAADYIAQAQADSAENAIETWATHHDGSYAGAAPEELATIGGDLAPDVDGLAVDSTQDTYTLSATSESGNIFTVARTATGSIEHSCQEPGTGACGVAGKAFGPCGKWGRLLQTSAAYHAYLSCLRSVARSG